ncbi:unnamed protein product [Trifolium pratense]|nr:unnamed protein product [Trifolium pratense]
MAESDDDTSDGGRFSYHSEELRGPISSSDEENESVRVIYPQFNAEAQFGEVRLAVEMEFATLAEFKKAVKDYTIHIGRQIKWIKNDKVRARAKCVFEHCKWEILCSRSSITNSFQIKTFENTTHSCPGTFTNSQADRKWVIEKLELRLRQQPSLSHSEAYYLMKEDYNLHLEDSMIYRSLKQAKQNVEGSEIDQYAKLWDYCHELLSQNPGSTVKMSTIPQQEGPPIFHRLYICFDASKRGFKEGCRPIIGLDGCFLKGYFGGQLLTAVGGDANNHIFVIAYAVVDVENKDYLFRDYLF